MHRRGMLPLTVLSLALAAPAMAQSVATQPENVRNEYAQVLRAEPVYQAVRPTDMVEICEQTTPVISGHQAPRRGIGRIVDSVKNVFSGDEDAAKAPPGKPADRTRKCRLVPMDKEDRRPIAYDVDYVHHGIKYRSRLPFDPGNRLRVRVSVMPIVPPGAGK
jgi:uncharacterized protein YcfJ